MKEDKYNKVGSRLDLMTSAYWNTTTNSPIDPLYVNASTEERMVYTTALIPPKGERQDHFFLQYWFFYLTSHLPPNPGSTDYTGAFGHEGDWEMCQICFIVTKLQTEGGHILAVTPFAMTASQHYNGQTIAWTAEGTAGTHYVEKYVTDQNRPVVYIACNSHATYFRSSSFMSYLYIVRGIFPAYLIDYTSNSGFTIITYNKEYFEPTDTWWKFDGVWGNKIDGFLNEYAGPGSPGSEDENKRQGRTRYGGYIHILDRPDLWHNAWINNPVNNWIGLPSLKITRSNP